MAEPFIGQVDLYGFNFVPENWAQCAGGTVPISSNQALFSLLGTAYGGDGRTNFCLPDLRGTFAVGQGQHPGSIYDWKMGNRRGNETHTLRAEELPRHTHTASFTGTPGSTSVTLSATKEAGDSNTPSTGSYLAQTAVPQAGRDKPEYIYKPDPTSGTTVPLAGTNTTGGGINGSVNLNNTGTNAEFNLIQASLISNYCIAMLGLFPSRS